VKLTGFNIEDYEDVNQDFEPLPAGEYRAIVADCEEKESRAGNIGLNLKIQIIEGQYENRLIFQWLNINHPKSNVQKIAEAELASIFRALNIQHPTDTAELLDQPLVVKLKVTKPENGYDAGNKVVKWMADKETAAPETSTKKPWEKA
jgi:hypothetical protein